MGGSPLNRRIRELLKNWVVPPGFLRAKRRISFERAYRLTAQEAAILSRNARFRDFYKGRRCFVIGNGPSLNRQDLAPLDGEITIVMNHFHNHPILERWQPTFYCVADPPETYTPRERELIKSVPSRIHAQAYFLPLATKVMVEEHDMFPPERTYFLKMWGALRDWPGGKYRWDLTGMVPAVRTTAHMAIMVALYLGCSPIYLIGFDHDWLAHRSVQRHFYASASQDVGSSDDLGTYEYKALVEGTLKTWELYEALQEVARERGIVIYNATAGGFLDVFPRVEFETLFPFTS